MPEFLQFLLQENLLLTLMTVFTGSFAMYYWMRPSDPNMVDSQSAIQMLNSGHGLYLDIRAKGEYDKGHIVNSKNIPSSELESKLDTIRKFKDKPVIVVCERGAQSPAASKKLREGGFEKVFLLREGMHGWKTANLPLVRK